MRTFFTIIIILLISIVLINFLKIKEKYEDPKEYHINVFPQRHNKHTSKYILYHNNQSVIESNNNKCIWDPLLQKHNLESVIKKTYENKFNNLILRKDKHNIYKIGDKYYLKHINDNLYHLSTHSDFHILDKIIHHNNINNKDTISIKNPNDESSDNIVYSKKIRDNVHPKYSLSGNQYLYTSKDNIVDPLMAFNLFFLIKEIHRFRYNVDFD